MTLCTAYLPIDGGPGQLAEVSLDVVSRGPAELVLPEVRVLDERGGDLLGDDLHFDPCAGGGPRAALESDREARAFGLVNVAFHAQRTLRTVAELLGRALPPLVIRLGMHEGIQRWGGGHYRLTARSYDPAETCAVAARGEIHLGGGSGFLPGADGRSYFAAPSHNLAIICHEIGHHICRHTADFRLNRLRAANSQTNKKVAVDEGTCDMITAIVLATPDIYRWHRGCVPEWDQRRRQLDPRWTMANFSGGRSDPHADGTIWASACWTARERVVAAGYGRARFDRMLIRGLDLSSASFRPERDHSVEPAAAVTQDALRERRHYAGLLAAMLRADPELTDPVLAGMAAHAIVPGATNAALRDAARASLLVAVDR